MFLKLFILIFCFCFTLQQIPGPSIAHPAHAAYNNFWDGAVGAPGYWGGTPKKDANVFNSKFDKKGMDSVYNLNQLSPFSSQRRLGFESLVPYYTPFGANRYTYYPTKSNHLNNKQLGSFSYDINEPRYQKLYEDYYDFFNTNLERLENLAKYHQNLNDVNNDHFRRQENPDSFDYTQLFDGFSEDNTLPMEKQKFLSFKGDLDSREEPVEASSLNENIGERRLTVKQKKKILIKKILTDIDQIQERKLQNKITSLQKTKKLVNLDKTYHEGKFNEIYFKMNNLQKKNNGRMFHSIV